MGPRCLLLLFVFFGVVSHAQQLDIVDFIRITADLEIDRSEKSVKGQVQLTAMIKQPVDSIYLDANEMEILSVTSPGISVRSSEGKIWIIGSFRADRQLDISFSYRATPSQTLYFFGDQVWSQGQGKYTSHWLPSLDDMNDKVEFDLSFTINDEDGFMDIVSNGNEIKRIRENGQLTVGFDMEKPMSSYLVAVAAGPFQRQEFDSGSGINNKLYYLQEDEVYFESTYRWSREIFDFLEEEIGMAYPWTDYKQVPVRDFLYAGMENTTATLFSQAFVTDSIGFADRNYVNVNAHELAHQWFGNLVTETSGDHHWLHEGFASYYALQAEKKLFGSEYYYWKLLQSAEQLQLLSDEGKGQSLLDPGASSLTFYEKGAWALHQLRTLVGDESFKAAILKYLTDHSYGNVSTSDFIAAVKANTLVDIDPWYRNWLEQSAFPAEEAYNVLKQEKIVQQYFEVSALRAKPLAEKQKDLERFLSIPDDYSGQEAIYQLSGEVGPKVRELYRIGLSSGNLMVRQAVALSLERIPDPLKEDYETLLEDPSYVTREAALYHLWYSFPLDRQRFLDKMDGQMGFQNRSLRQLWLVLALATTDYRQGNRGALIKELRDYTMPDYSFEIREGALEYLHQLQAHDDQSLKSLVDACMHPNWRFRKAARGMLKEAIGTPAYRTKLVEMLGRLKEDQKKYLESVLGE
ncbi:M1 family metallopeptidase [Aureitalea marina]|uniref:Aminopeptidase N n=1 Tax=Aureitalea marina TaxID=930804 RepID=A0A2S7KN57_9FLAO|nr:M1 family metallopeptidase [Aureitalea marina]PQB04064.1 aminopeptidase [Aureitalea marina]